MSGDPHPDPVMRRALRVLRMVHELHKLGYQRLRIVPGMSPSGCHWRCSVTHAGNTLKIHGAMFRDHQRECAHYTTGQDNEYFGWADARDDTVQQLAAKFLERFPEIARLGHDRDWPYAGWYVEMLGFAERGAFPMSYADWLGAPEAGRLPTTESESDPLPMPPAARPRSGSRWPRSGPGCRTIRGDCLDRLGWERPSRWPGGGCGVSTRANRFVAVIAGGTRLRAEPF